jgi:hypothetical protein
MLGGSISPRPCNFVNISNTLASNTTIPTSLGDSTIASPPIVAIILQQQLDYIYIDFNHDHIAPDES